MAEKMTLLSSYLDDGGWHDEANNVRNGIDIESYEIELRLIEWLTRHLTQPAQAVDVGKVVGYLVEKKPRVVGDAPARSFYFADQHNPTDPNWWIAGEQKKYTVTPLTRAISGEKAAAVKNGRKRRSSVTSAQTPPSPPPQRRARRGR